MPFREYCNEKLKLLASDLFVRVFERYCEVKGKGVDGSVFVFDATSNSDMSTIPLEAGQISIEWALQLRGFQATDTSYVITIDLRYNLEGSRWIFAVSRGIREDYRREHVGSDIAELQAQFKDLLRWMMTELKGLREARRQETSPERPESVLKRWFGGWFRGRR